MDLSLPRILCSPEPYPKLEFLMEILGTLGMSLRGIPPPPKKKPGWKLLLENLGTLGMSLPRIPPPQPPRMETSHGDLWDFGYELT